MSAREALRQRINKPEGQKFKGNTHTSSSPRALQVGLHSRMRTFGRKPLPNNSPSSTRSSVAPSPSNLHTVLLSQFLAQLRAHNSRIKFKYRSTKCAISRLAPLHLQPPYPRAFWLTWALTGKKESGRKWPVERWGVQILDLKPATELWVCLSERPGRTDMLIGWKAQLAPGGAGAAWLALFSSGWREGGSHTKRCSQQGK